MILKNYLQKCINQQRYFKYSFELAELSRVTSILDLSFSTQILKLNI